MPSDAEVANQMGQLAGMSTFNTLYDQRAVAKDSPAVASGRTVAGAFAMGCMVTALVGSAWLRLRRSSDDGLLQAEAFDNVE